MTVHETTSEHPDSDLLAAFAEGKLERREIRGVLAHLDRCAACRVAVELANETVAEELETPSEQPKARSWWLAVAAAVVLAILAVPLARYLTRAPVDELVRLAPRSARVLEPRLTGGFAWAPYRGPERAGDSQKTAEWLKLRGAAGMAIEEAERKRSIETQHTAAIARVLVEDEEKAAAQLRAIVERAPGNAQAWSDLAAAEYTVAVRGEAPSHYASALAAADRALRIDPKLPEALFNRALIVTQLGVQEEARAAWRRYLAVDSSSPWATEARTHLQQLSPRNGAGFSRDQQLLEKAAAAGDQAPVLTLVAAYPQQSRTYAEAEYLGRWGEAAQKDDAEAQRLLTIARGIGHALARSTGETLLRDAVAAIDAAPPATRTRLAAAHAGYRAARLAYRDMHVSEAERGLRAVARELAAAGSPMALVARSYAASARLAQSDVTAAAAEMQPLLVEVSSHPGYIALGAQIRWELARSHVGQDEITAAIELLTAAEQAFSRLGERGNAAFVETMLASLLGIAGNPEEAWKARIRSFTTLSAESAIVQIATGLDGAASIELRAGRPAAALALLDLEEALGRNASNDLLLSQALVHKSMIHSTIAGDAALATAQEAETVTQRIPDAGRRERQTADVGIATAAAITRTEPQRAIGLLSRSIDFYRAHALPLFLPQPLLLRARAALRTGDAQGALRDLDEGMATIEQHRLALAGNVTGATLHPSGDELFEEAIRTHLVRGDVASALAATERARAATAGQGTASGRSLAQLQQHLAGTGATLLELVALEDEVVAFAITASDMDVSRRPVARAELAALGSRALARDPAASRRLYDLLILPSAATIAKARSVIIVPDFWLEEVPFAALQDANGRYLIEVAPLAIAPRSASLEEPGAGARTPRLAAIALPSDRSLDTLPETVREIAEIGAFYRNLDLLPANRASFASFVAAASRADVVHIAGHTARRKGGGDPALVFASGERVAWNDIAAGFGAHPDVVLLSACETLRRRRTPQTRTLSLGGAFLAAGAAGVIGTLAPINDRDALELFRSIHEQLAGGSSAAEALRHAQMNAIAAEKSGGTPGGWRTVALLTNRIPDGGLRR